MTGRGQHTLMVLVATGSMLSVIFAGCSDDNTGSGGAGGTGGAASSASVGPAPASGPASSSVGSGAGAGPPMTNLGTTCLQDSDCDSDMRCIQPSTDSPVLGGGAVGGYCTKDCVSNTDCGPGGRCLVPDGTSTGECYQTCVVGPALANINEPLNPNKCHGREDARCSPINGGEDICLPNCGEDSQCGARFCNARSGACVDDQSTGKGIGELCDETAPDNDGCAGFCQTFTNDTPSICSSPCVLGGELEGVDCGGGLTSGLCVYRPSGFGAGDFGRCALACTQHDQCGNPAWWCMSNDYAPNGFCFTTEDCPQGDPQCGQGEKCIDTLYGPKCLDVDMNDELVFPLGTAAPGTGGGGGAGGGAGVGGAGVGGAGVGGAGVGGAGVGGTAVGGAGGSGGV